MNAAPEHSTIYSDVTQAEIEHPVNIGRNVDLRAVKIGHYSLVNSDAIIYGNTILGRFVSIGRRCQIAIPEHPVHFLSTSPFQFSTTMFANDPKQTLVKKIPNTGPAQRTRGDKTTIGNDVWVGGNAIVLRGISIGDGAVIAAGAVVTKDVPPYAVAAGVPARIGKYRFDEGTIEKLLALKWWDRPLEDLASLPFDDIQECIKRLERQGK